MAFLGRPDEFDADRRPAYVAEVRKRMDEHKWLRTHHVPDRWKRRAELHVEIDLLLDMIRAADIVFGAQPSNTRDRV